MIRRFIIVWIVVIGWKSIRRKFSIENLFCCPECGNKDYDIRYYGNKIVCVCDICARHWDKEFI